MTAILLNGFLTGLLLQIAIGPVFFFILNLSLQRTLIDGLIAVVAVTLVDYIFIVLAVVGVGKLLEQPKTKTALGIISPVVLILFGIVMILSAEHANSGSYATTSIQSDYLSSFASTFLLTISSPLTIVFWTSLFAAKAIEMGYTKNQLILFGLSAGSATFVFLGLSVLLFSFCRASIPILLLKIANSAVGLLLLIYGVYRIFKLYRINHNDG